MKHPPRGNSEAFTLIELIGVIVVLVVVVAFVLSSLDHGQSRAPRIACVNNLKQIGVAYRMWSNDNGDRFPALQSVRLGGWKEFLTNAGEGFLVWTNYAIMSNELGQSTRLLICPSDERQPAETFGTFASDGFLSYFTGVGADDSQPQSMLAGDRNLGPGIKPVRDYGFSPMSGKGNDVAIQTNSQVGPVCWSLKTHSDGNSQGAGNILLGDGSAQEVTTLSFRQNWQPFAGITTNWPAGHVPSSPAFRVLFP